MEQTECIRGLDIRVALALARVDRISDPELADRSMGVILSDSYLLGFREAGAGLYQPPRMFHDERELLGAWYRGQNDAALCAQMLTCDCHDDRCLKSWREQPQCLRPFARTCILRGDGHGQAHL
ncbi:hypothetical protein GJ700_02590 [Duganella sp. FT92W]|uniref:Uncharacterized protein n=1 Tax=Pseudoduganella rivuli TaxID=2666085 RepID=A0A7X2LS55_9BURK|nr:hypothetical protein [Pseudoduganella rivuli]MRV70607.1 hypothetical protein [Pseudoduganella rivuli]